VSVTVLKGKVLLTPEVLGNHLWDDDLLEFRRALRLGIGGV
jgi:hypothetical protein